MRNRKTTSDTYATPKLSFSGISGKQTITSASGFMAATQFFNDFQMAAFRSSWLRCSKKPVAIPA